MPIYVIVAYAIFCAVPLGLGLILRLRFRRLMRDIERIDSSADGSRTWAVDKGRRP